MVAVTSPAYTAKYSSDITAAQPHNLAQREAASASQKESQSKDQQKRPQKNTRVMPSQETIDRNTRAVKGSLSVAQTGLHGALLNSGEVVEKRLRWTAEQRAGAGRVGWAFFGSLPFS